MQNVFLGDPKEGKEEVRFFEVPDITERSVVAEVSRWLFTKTNALGDTLLEMVRSSSDRGYWPIYLYRERICGGFR